MNLVDEIAKYAEKYDVPSQIAFAVAQVESANSMTAIRFESHYQWLWDCRQKKPFRRVSPSEVPLSRAPRDFPAPPSAWGFYASPDTEWIGQKTSWGPFQIMGAVLREAGYTQPFPELCRDESLAALWGCRHLSHLKNRFQAKHGWDGVVAAFNAGRPRIENGKYINQDYVNKIAKAGASKFVRARY